MTITENLTSVQELQFLQKVTSNLVPVEIIKDKKGVATLIKCNSQQYVVQHPSHMRNDQNLKRKAK